MGVYMKAKTLLIVVGVVLFVLSAAQAQNSNPAEGLTKPTEYQRKSVGFIRVVYHDRDRAQEKRGTCFFVFYEDQRLDTSSNGYGRAGRGLSGSEKWYVWCPLYLLWQQILSLQPCFCVYPVYFHLFGITQTIMLQITSSVS